MKKEKCDRCGKVKKCHAAKFSEKEGWIDICDECLELELSDEVWGGTL
jgi:hypothetical protein